MPDIHYYLHQIKVLPLQEIFRRGFLITRQKISDKLTKIEDHLFDTEISDNDFLKSAWNQDCIFRNAQGVIQHFRERKKPAFFMDASRRDEIVPVINKHFQGEKDRAIVRADSACKHVFNLLGSGSVNLDDNIDWHRDFKIGYHWSPKTYYRDVSIPYDNADIKVPWELSRFSHAITLGQAYCLTKDDTYAREFVNQVSDWIDRNKPKFGVNWACTMDVAIRVCNWIAGYSLLKASPRITDAFLLKFLKSLYQHGRHIRTNLEYSEILTSNHYLSNIAGLVYIGIMFPEFKEAQEWKTFGIQELIKEMEKQVYPDGCDFEASTCYHRLVLELFFFPTLLVVINASVFRGDNHLGICREIFGEEYTERLKKMFEALLYLLKPNGMMPQIGDNDSGRLHIFARCEVLDMRYLLTLGAIFFREPKFKVKEFGFSEEALWIFGEEGYKVWQSLKENSFKNLKSMSFSDAGWYVMRNNRDYLLISCGSNGQNGNGGHAHNDKLSFELCIDGEDIFVDPGTYVYTPKPDMRNLFRSTAYHNTVWIEGLEQNRMPQGNNGLFHLEDDAKAKVTGWECSAEEDRYAGEHYGFSNKGITHKREICFQKNEGLIVINDLLQGEQIFFAIAFFHLHPDVKPILKGNSVMISDKINIFFQGESDISISEYFYSSEYGSKVTSQVIKVIFYKELLTEFRKINV